MRKGPGLLSYRLRAALGTAVVAGSLALSGCGGDTNVAARFDGHVVTEQDVASAVKDVRTAFPQTQFDARQALTMLIQAPYLIDHAAKSGYPTTASMAKAQIPMPDPSNSTVRIIQSTSVIDKLSEADKIALSKQLTDLKVTVNPKYGSYDPTQAAVGPNTPDWLEFVAADS